jgi:hypothetical protein
MKHFLLGFGFLFPVLLLAQNPVSISTISALRGTSVTGLTDGTYILLGGYYSAAEGPNGGGGLFRYNLSSSATDDGGVTIAPSSGSGRWIRQFSGEVNIMWYGAKGDNSTDDAPSIQAAGQEAIDIGTGLFIPAPPGGVAFLIGSEGIAWNGSISIRGIGKASFLRGTNVYGAHSIDIGTNIRISTQFSETHQPANATSTYMATGQSLTAGVNSLTLGTVTGLSVGSEVLIEYGSDSNDASLPDYFNWCKITNITGSVVTFDSSPPRSINGTTHHVYLVTIPAKNIIIQGLGSQLLAFNLAFCQGGVVRDIYQNQGYFLFLFGQSSINLLVDNISIEEALAAASGLVQTGIYGSAFYGYASRNITARNVTIRRQHFGNPFNNDGTGETVEVDNWEVNMNPDFTGNDSTGQVVLFGTSASFKGLFLIKNIKLNAQVSSSHRGTDQFILQGGPAFRYENVRMDGLTETPVNGQYPFTFSAAVMFGELDCFGYTFSDIENYRRVIPVPASFSGSVPLGVSGILRTMRVYASDASHITNFFSGSGGNQSSSLSTGQFVDISPIITAYASHSIDGSELSVDVASNSGTVAGTYLVVEGSYFRFDNSESKSNNLIYGSGAPTLNAQFKGQVYFDVTNNSEYFAIGSGSGSSDWVKWGH